MNGFILFLWFTISGLPWILSVESCTKGFMDYDLLVQKAEQIGGDGKGNLSDNKQKSMTVDWIMPYLQFTCSGTITGFLLGVDVRTETNSIDQYPTIWLWNKTKKTNTYIRDKSVQLQVRFGPSNFSTNGVFQFNLSTPLQFTANEVLGIHQPDSRDSVVRFYYQNDSGQKIYETPDNASSYTLSESSSMNWRLLIHPESNSPQCISGFISSDEIKIQAREITRVRGYNNTERFFPDIGFTCNGNITHIIIGAEDQNGTQFPQIRFWRLSDEGEYEQTGSSYSLVYNDANDTSTTNLRWYNLSQPIQVQNGDVLGIDQPREMDSELTLYFQDVSGPPNYDSNGNIRDNHYPLVSVIFERKAMTSNTMTISEDKSFIMSPTVEVSSMSLPTSSMNSTSETQEGFPVQLKVIAGVGTGLLLLSIIVILIIILIVKHRKRTTLTNSSKDEHVTAEVNPSYNIHTVSDEHVTTEDNPSYNIQTVSDEQMLINDYPSYDIHTVSGIDNIHNVLIVSLNDDQLLNSQKNM